MAPETFVLKVHGWTIGPIFFDSDDRFAFSNKTGTFGSFLPIQWYNSWDKETANSDLKEELWLSKLSG